MKLRSVIKKYLIIAQLIVVALALIWGFSANDGVPKRSLPKSKQLSKQKPIELKPEFQTDWDDKRVAVITEQVLSYFTPENSKKRPFKIQFIKPKVEGRVFVELRSGGLHVATVSFEDVGWSEDIPKVINMALLNSQKSWVKGAIDSLVLVLTHSWRSVDGSNPGYALSNMQRGVLGVSLQYGDKLWLRSPTEFISQNRSIEHFLGMHQKAVGVEREQYRKLVEVKVFDGYQFLVKLDKDDITTTPMFRGNTLVPIDAVNKQRVTDLAEAQSTWMLKNLSPDGRMLYSWWPSAGKEGNGDNSIRQFMATACLGRIGKWKGSEDILKRQEKNLAYNLSKLYSEEDGFGLIRCQQDVKLGAIGLAALCLLERPDLKQYDAVRDALLRTTYHLLQDDGSFHTFYRPAERRFDNQNFYTGEAMLAWARLYQSEPDKALLERYMRAFRYYRKWHLEPRNRNPAFIPWHTQAHFLIWEKTKDPELLRFVFEMNDWLVAEMQQWNKVVYDDMRGRFYKGGGRYGPPHASSTGVYLEGLIDAFEMARQVGDKQRAERYRTAIRRGLRSVMQLTFLDDVDMFYVSKRDQVYGGVRETEYDNKIRVDNVQHNLMAILKILERFSEKDFQ